MAKLSFSPSLLARCTKDPRRGVFENGKVLSNATVDTGPAPSPLPPSRPPLLFFRGALGDFVLFLPVVDAFLRRFGSVELVAPEAGRWLYGLHPGVVFSRSDDVFWSKLHQDTADARLIERFSSRPAVILTTADPEGHLRRRLVGWGLAGAVRWHPPFPIGGVPVLAHHHALIRQTLDDDIPLGPPSLPRRQRPVPVLREDSGAPILTPYILLHPGSGGGHKNWPLAGFLEVRERLLQRKITAVMIFGPADEVVLNEAQMAVGATTGWVTGRNLGEAVDWLRGASVYVGLDSGLSHVAQACGVPSVLLVPEKNRAFWQGAEPLGRVLYAENIKNDPTPDEVLRAFDDLRKDSSIKDRERLEGKDPA